MILDEIDGGFSYYYVQLYIPFDYFKRGAQMIKSCYSQRNQYLGYHNFMHYWAKNGEYDWIDNTSEYDGATTGIAPIKYSWSTTAFWNNFDGTMDPLGNRVTAGQEYKYSTKTTTGANTDTSELTTTTKTTMVWTPVERN